MPVAAAKAFVGDGEGDGLIHLEERHRWVARVVLEFAHDAVIAALDMISLRTWMYGSFSGHNIFTPLDISS